MAKTKKETEVSENSGTLCGYVIVNADKLDRAINGRLGAEGQLVGGVGEDATDEAKLAEYDRLGGLIRTKDGYAVKTGSFFNFKDKKPHKDPKVMLTFRDLKGDEVEVEEDAPVPIEVRAAMVAKNADESKKKGKKDIESEDEE